MQAFQVLTEPPITVEPATTIDEVREIMAHYRIRHLPVMQDGQVIGMVSDRDHLIIRGWAQQAVGDTKPPTRDGAGVDFTDIPQRVEQIMSSPVYCIRSDTYIEQVIEMMVARNISGLPVTDYEGLVGVLTKTDLMQWYRAHCAEDPSQTAGPIRVEDCMQRTITIGRPDDTVRDIVDRMVEARVQHLPIVDEGRLVGIVSDRDLRMSLGITVRGFDGRQIAPRPKEDQIRASTIMTANPITVAPHDRMVDGMALMLAGKFSALPVVENGNVPIGIVTLTDVTELIRVHVAPCARMGCYAL